MAEYPTHSLPCYHYKSLCSLKSNKVVEQYFWGKDQRSRYENSEIYDKLKLFNVNEELKTSVVENLPCTEVMLVKDWSLVQRIGETKQEMKHRQPLWRCTVYVKRRERQEVRKYLENLNFLGVCEIGETE